MQNSESKNREMVVEGTAVLKQTGDNFARSTVIPIETKTTGKELGEPQGSFVYTRNGFKNEQQGGVRPVLKRMGHKVWHNRMALILIIVAIKFVIIVTVLYVKFY